MSQMPGDPQRRGLEGPRSSREALQALQTVYIETEALYQQSSAFLEQIYHQGALSLGRRNVLLRLKSLGPQTVPEMARAKSVSRQYIQKLVNQLLEEGYVEYAEDSTHKRSRLVQLTPRGSDYMAVMVEREIRIVKEMEITIPVETLHNTAESLRAIREWQKKELGRLSQKYADG